MGISRTRIVFMGTPVFAVASLRALVEGGYNVVAVVTQPDKPVGRHGSTLQPPPVKQYALEMGLPVLQPVSLCDPAFLDILRSFRPDIQIVVAFRMLPPEVFSLPPLGTFNLHTSLLPQYRGAAPINWAIIYGETQTGLTTFLLDAGMDTGNIILQRSVPIAPNDTAGTLHDTLMQHSPAIITETINLLLSGIPILHPQIPSPTLIGVRKTLVTSDLRSAPKLSKENCRIFWNQPTSAIHNFIRGLSPTPAAWTLLHIPDHPPRQLKIYLSEPLSRLDTELPVGALIPDHKARTLDVVTPDGLIRLLSLQLEGKKRLPASDFLNGLPSSPTYFPA
jgi:methionyl-tRNA formyltransferase